MKKEIVHVVSALIVGSERGHVFMQRRSATTLRPRLWEYPGGKVLRGEGRRKALAREVAEELNGVRVTVGRLIKTVDIEFEYPARLHLFAVDVHKDDWSKLRSVVRQNDQTMAWLLPKDAIQNWPCTPSTYLWYRSVCRFLDVTRWL